MQKICDEKSTFFGSFLSQHFSKKFPYSSDPWISSKNLKNPPAEDNSCLSHDEELQWHSRTLKGHEKAQVGQHTNLTAPRIAWLLLLDEYKWIWNHMKNWERQSDEWVMETLPCGGRISLAARAPPFPQVLPAAGCVTTCTDVQLWTEHWTKDCQVQLESSGYFDVTAHLVTWSIPKVFSCAWHIIKNVSGKIKF